MKRKCGSLFFLWLASVFFPGLDASCRLAAQTSLPDSVASGHLVVKKTLVRAALLISFEYTYSAPDSSLVRSWENDIHPVNPPVPDTVSHDSIRARPARGRQVYYDPMAGRRFDARKYFAAMNYCFQPLDSVRYDSARVEFFIAADGKTVIVPRPWLTTGASTRAFEKLVFAACEKLKWWEPATELRSGGTVVLPVASKVTLTIFAFDLNTFDQEIFIRETVR